jgi:hypothetical protein
VNFKRYWKLINEKVTTKREDTASECMVNIAKTPLLVIT